MKRAVVIALVMFTGSFARPGSSASFPPNDPDERFAMELTEEADQSHTVTRCYAQAYYTGEICCRVACVYPPKVAKCVNPSHPSFCRDAWCGCVDQ